MAKKKKIDPNRFHKQDDKGLFTFDPIRLDVFKWGLIAGLVGGSFMLYENLLAQIVGVFIIVFISNYHISKASRRIPRWHATIISFIGVMVAMVGVIVIGTTLIAYYRPTGG